MATNPQKQEEKALAQEGKDRAAEQEFARESLEAANREQALDENQDVRDAASRPMNKEEIKAQEKAREEGAAGQLASPELLEEGEKLAEERGQLDPPGTGGTRSAHLSDDGTLPADVVFSFSDVPPLTRVEDVANKMAHPTPSFRSSHPVLVRSVNPAVDAMSAEAKLELAYQEVDKLTMLLAAAVQAAGGVLRFAAGDFTALRPGSQLGIPNELNLGEDFVVTLQNDVVRPPGGQPSPPRETLMIGHRVRYYPQTPFPGDRPS